MQNLCGRRGGKYSIIASRNRSRTYILMRNGEEKNNIVAGRKRSRAYIIIHMEGYSVSHIQCKWLTNTLIQIVGVDLGGIVNRNV